MLGHRFAVGAKAGLRRIPRLGFTEAVVAAGHHEARRQALDVPFPGGGQGLVQVVDGENDPAFRRGESPEIAQVGVAAALDVHAGDRGGGEVGGHGERRAPEEGERGAGHAPVAEREQVGQPALLGRQDHRDRVRPAGRRLPVRVGAARTCVP
jgi:hypothetical protein